MRRARPQDERLRVATASSCQALLHSRAEVGPFKSHMEVRESDKVDVLCSNSTFVSTEFTLNLTWESSTRIWSDNNVVFFQIDVNNSEAAQWEQHVTHFTLRLKFTMDDAKEEERKTFFPLALSLMHFLSPPFLYIPFIHRLSITFLNPSRQSQNARRLVTGSEAQLSCVAEGEKSHR